IDEIYNATIDDINNVTGIIKGDVALVEGKIDSAFSFNINKTGIYVDDDGDDHDDDDHDPIDYVDFGMRILGEVFGKTNNIWTVGMWIHPTTLHSDFNEHGASNTFFCRGGDDSNLELGISPLGYLQVYINSKFPEEDDDDDDDDGILGIYGEIGAIPVNQWSFVAVVYDEGNVSVLIGNDHEDNWYFSTIDGENPWNGSISLEQSNGHFTLGFIDDLYTYYSGFIDELYIFNKSLAYWEVEKLKNALRIKAVASKRVDGAWSPISSDDVIEDGFINLECYKFPSVQDVEKVEFYLANRILNISDLENENLTLINTYYGDRKLYSYVMNIRDIPDNDTWYFVIKATGIDGNYTYDIYDIKDQILPFSIKHFNTSMSFTYLGIDNKINFNSQIGVVTNNAFKKHVNSLSIYLNVGSDSYLLNDELLYFFDIQSNNDLIDLSLLSIWLQEFSIPINEYNASFNIVSNLDYEDIFGTFIYNYSLKPVTLDFKGPKFDIIEGTPYSLEWGKYYDNILDFILTARANFSGTDHESITIQYQYDSPQSDWITYNTFYSEQSQFDISINLLNMRDDKINFRFISRDKLGNSKLLEDSTFWIIKDFDNHLDFVVEGIDENYIYSIGFNNSIELDIGIIPEDNDITHITILTDYENFNINNFYYIEDHTYFTDVIYLDANLYDIIGGTFSQIPIELQVYQGQKFLTSKTIVITVTDTVFEDPIKINDLDIDILTLPPLPNIFMNFTITNKSYINSHNIPLVVNNNPPTVKIYNSKNNQVGIFSLKPDWDDFRTKVYNNTEIEIINNQFILPKPTELLYSENISSIEGLIIDNKSFEFNYYIDSEEILIKLITSEVKLNGIYGIIKPIIINYSITNSVHENYQYQGSFDFHSLPQDYYRFSGEFIDISGIISEYIINQSILIDFEGPEIYKQFLDFKPINPEFGSISFILNDASQITDYSFNRSIDGFWTVDNDIYTFNFNDSELLEDDSPLFLQLKASDANGYETTLNFSLIIDKTKPYISQILNDFEIFNGLYRVTILVDEISSYIANLVCINNNTGIVYDDLDLTITEITDGIDIVFDTKSLPNGFYNITIVLIDTAGNLEESFIGVRYFDNTPPIITNIEENIFVNSQLLYSKEIQDIIYFNENKSISLNAYDMVFDGFNWSNVDPSLGLGDIGDKLGIFDVRMKYSNPLKFHNVTIEGTLNFDKLIYRIIGYDESPLNTEVRNIKNIQKIKIGNITINEFTILITGESIYFEVNPEYGFLLDPSLTDKIQVEFYELSAEEISFEFDPLNIEWNLRTPGENYYNISENLPFLNEGDKFQIWFSLEDGMGNELITKSYDCIFDNTIKKVQGSSSFYWNLGTTTDQKGIILMGSDEWKDRTININATSILQNSFGEIDIERVLLYTSDDGGNYEYLGRARISENNMWSYYWNLDLITNPPGNINYLKALIFDKSGNFIEEIREIEIYDYSNIELLINLTFGSIFEFDDQQDYNINEFIGNITNFTGTSDLWDIVVEYYNSKTNNWIPLATTSSQIISGGGYTVTWDINQDPEFMASIYSTKYDYLPFQVSPLTDSNIWGSWGNFHLSSNMQPIIIAEENSKLNITIFKFDAIQGFVIDSQVSIEGNFDSLEGQVFKLFDLNNDGIDEIVRIASSQVDVIYLNSSSNWEIKINSLVGYQFFSFDLYYDFNLNQPIMVVNQKDTNNELSLRKFTFDSVYSLIATGEFIECPLDFIPTVIKIIENYLNYENPRILVGGLIEESYNSQIMQYDYNLNLEYVFENLILGKLTVVEYSIINSIETLIIGTDRLAVGKLDAVITLKFISSTGKWEKFEITNFDKTRFEILDLLLIHDINLQNLIVASKTGLYEVALEYKQDVTTVTTPISYTSTVISKSEINPPDYIIELQKVPIHSIYQVLYKNINTNDWSILHPTYYQHSNLFIDFELDEIWDQLDLIKIAYAYISYESKKSKLIDTTIRSRGGAPSSQSISASSMFFDDTRLPLLWLNPTAPAKPYSDWKTFSYLNDRNINFRSIPVISSLGSGVFSPNLKLGWDEISANSYDYLPELKNSLIDYSTDSYDTGELSQFLNGKDDDMGEIKFDGSFDGNYIDGTWISNPVISQNYDFRNMYQESLYSKTGLYNTYDPDGAGVNKANQQVLLRNQLVDFKVLGDIKNSGIMESGLLPEIKNISINEYATWNFDEGQGATVYDLIKGLDGLSSSPTYISGKIGPYALNFNGIDDHIKLPVIFGQEQQNFTFSAWLNVNVLKLATIFAEYTQDSDAVNYISMYANGSVGYNCEPPQSSMDSVQSNVNLLTPGEWIHLAVTRHGNNITFYKNGIQFGQKQVFNKSYTGSTPTLAAIGARVYQNTWNNLNFDGAIDDVKIYNRSLTADEISLLNSITNSIETHFDLASIEDINYALVSRDKYLSIQLDRINELLGFEARYKLPNIKRYGLNSIQVAFDGSIVTPNINKEYPISVQIWNNKKYRWESIPLSTVYNINDEGKYDIDELAYDFWTWDVNQGIFTDDKFRPKWSSLDYNNINTISFGENFPTQNDQNQKLKWFNSGSLVGNNLLYSPSGKDFYLNNTWDLYNKFLITDLSYNSNKFQLENIIINPREFFTSSTDFPSPDTSFSFEHRYTLNNFTANFLNSNHEFKLRLVTEKEPINSDSSFLCIGDLNTYIHTESN
ncbi:MAG: LamG-like jellyroll fold domain-containing protein, partial [Candidatus Hodarchaeales archaeon]